MANWAVEEGGIAGAWRAKRAPVTPIIPSHRGVAGPRKVSIHLLRLKPAGLAARSNI